MCLCMLCRSQTAQAVSRGHKTGLLPVINWYKIKGSGPPPDSAASTKVPEVIWLRLTREKKCNTYIGFFIAVRLSLTESK